MVALRTYLQVKFCNIFTIFYMTLPFMSVKSEQQIILGAFSYLIPSKFNQLGKIVFSFFG